LGYPDGSFGGRQPVSRQDLAIVIARLVGLSGEELLEDLLEELLDGLVVPVWL